MLICEDVQIEKSFRRIERNYNRRLAVASANDNMSEIRQVQRDFTGALEYYAEVFLEHNAKADDNETNVQEIDIYFSDRVKRYLVMHKRQFIDAGTIKSSCVKRTCICCGKTIVGLGLTDFRDAGLSICFDCCTDNNYFNDDIRLINYL